MVDKLIDRKLNRMIKNKSRVKYMKKGEISDSKIHNDNL